jgi:hypothetical protein
MLVTVDYFSASERAGEVRGMMSPVERLGRIRSTIAADAGRPDLTAERALRRKPGSGSGLIVKKARGEGYLV